MNMRRVGVLLVAVAMVGALALPAQALTVDTLIGGIDSANSGQAYEEAQLELACGCNVTLLSNVDTDTFQTDPGPPETNFIDVAPNEPGYFILKFGTGNTGNDMFFFQNIGELTKLVWTDAQLIGAGLPENHVQSISHYAITENGTNVPEPGTLMLVGLGLGAVGIVGRKP